MKKSIRKTVSYLKRYIGFEVIRTKPTSIGDWSYTATPIIIVGFTPKGEIRYRYTSWNKVISEDKEFILSDDFTDRNWITYKKALRAKHNELNKWRGKRIKRIRPTESIGDHSYMCSFILDEAPTLVSASKHHMVIEQNDFFLKGKKTVLRADFIKPEDWVLV